MTTIETRPSTTEEDTLEQHVIYLPRDRRYVRISSDNRQGLRGVLSLLTGGAEGFKSHAELVAQVRNAAHSEARRNGENPPDPTTIAVHLPALEPAIDQPELVSVLRDARISALVELVCETEARLLIEQSRYL
ncbi:MAG TPA: hypothetical protein VFN56_02395 [Candidatus Saccharimonadales bacterium]|nr:hypothetical protein [Candidatus Saccharimonadales bacterium]